MNQKEEHLIQLCKRGDKKAQNQLYLLFYGYAKSICMRFSTNEEDTKELLNDSFCKALLNLRSYENTHAFKIWLRRIIINSAIDRYRKKGLLYGTNEKELLLAPSQHLTGLDTLGAEDIIGAIQCLSEKQQMVFNLYEIEGYSHKEIASMMEIKESFSRTLLVRAKSKLKELLLPKRKCVNE